MRLGIIPLRGREISIGFVGSHGADWSDSDGHVSVTAAVGNVVGALSSGGLPATGNTTLRTETVDLTTVDTSFGVTGTQLSPITIPSDAQMLVIRFLNNPTGTAGADDWFQIRKVAVNTGQFVRPFREQSVATIKARLGVVGNSVLAGLAGSSPAADKLLRATSSTAFDTIDFKEGTATATVTFATPGDLSVVYTVQSINYQRVGRYVTAFIELAYTPTFTTASGEFRISGLPYTSAAEGGGPISNVNIGAFASWAGTGTQLEAVVPAATAYVILRASKAAANAAPQQASNITSGSSAILRFSVRYRV
jgi:hypothetical protein